MTRAPRGETPTLERVSDQHEISSIVLLTAPLDGRGAALMVRHFIGTIDAVERTESLPYFRRRVGTVL